MYIIHRKNAIVEFCSIEVCYFHWACEREVYFGVPVGRVSVRFNLVCLLGV